MTGQNRSRPTPPIRQPYTSYAEWQRQLDEYYQLVQQWENGEEESSDIRCKESPVDEEHLDKTMLILSKIEELKSAIKEVRGKEISKMQSNNTPPEGRFVVMVQKMQQRTTKSGHPAVYMQMLVWCREEDKSFEHHEEKVYYHQPIDNPTGLSVIKRMLRQMELECLKDTDIESLDMNGVFGLLPACEKELKDLALAVTIFVNSKGYVQYDDWTVA